MIGMANRVMRGAGIVFCTLLFFATPVSAQDNSASVAPATYRLLQRVEKLIAESAFGEASKSLNAMLPEVGADSLDQAVILRSMASVYSLQGKYREAAKALEKSIATKALPAEQVAAARWNLGELYAASEQYPKAAHLLESALKRVKKPDRQQYFLLANVFAQLKKYDQAARYLRNAIAGQKTPDESWFKMLLAMYYESGNYQEAAKILKQMIERDPSNKEYWLQLIAMYQQMNRYKQALAVSELAYREGLIDSAQEIINLANLMSHQDAPYRAAELLEKEINAGRLASTSKNWEKVANAWSQAREFDHAVAALKKASRSHPSGELDFRIAQIYVEEEKWKDAHRELTEALRKGGLNDPGTAYILLGITSYELNLEQQARNAFIKAQQFAATRDTGRQWVRYIDSE